uniref:Uncharacterized protein n=1 Tax=Panagrolaimus sp. JU765 TaxID=591449 RepID=A0AC34RAZ9_9BILA
MKEENIPDVVLIRKCYDRTTRLRHRNWKLKRIIDQQETSSVAEAFVTFMEDIEEDPALREKINIYRDRTKPENVKSEIDIPTLPNIAEMLDDLQLNDDVEMIDE